MRHKPTGHAHRAAEMTNDPGSARAEDEGIHRADPQEKKVGRFGKKCRRSSG